MNLLSLGIVGTGALLVGACAVPTADHCSTSAHEPAAIPQPALATPTHQADPAQTKALWNQFAGELLGMDRPRRAEVLDVVHSEVYRQLGKAYDSRGADGAQAVLANLETRDIQGTPYSAKSIKDGFLIIRHMDGQELRVPLPVLRKLSTQDDRPVRYVPPSAEPGSVEPMPFGGSSFGPWDTGSGRINP